MDITFDGDHAAINLPDRDIDISLDMTIQQGRVAVCGHAQTPGGYITIDFTASGYETWIISDAEDLFSDRSNPEILRTVITYALVAVDQWATPERFDATNIAEAETKVAAARDAYEKAEADLTSAKDVLVKARSVR